MLRMGQERLSVLKKQAALSVGYRKISLSLHLEEVFRLKCNSRLTA